MAIDMRAAYAQSLASTASPVPSPMTNVARGKVGKTLGEFSAGTLRSGSKTGPLVTNPAQAKAIAMSQARRAQ